MSKFRIAVLVLLVATVIYTVTFALRGWHYQSWLTEMTVELKAKGFIVNPESFFSTSEAQHFILTGVALAAVWIVLLNLREWKAEKKTMLALTLLFPLVFSMFSLVSAALNIPYLDSPSKLRR